VDALAERVGRSALLDDAAMTPLAYSRQDSELDAVRRASILLREVPAAARSALLEHGVDRAQGAVRTPAFPAIGLAPRLCVPVRADGELLGYLWLIDDGLDADAVAAATATANEAAQRLDGLVRRRERELVADLVSADPARAQRAIDALSPERHASPGAWAVCVVSVVPDSHAGRDWIERNLRRLQRLHGRDAALWSADGAHHIVLLATGSPAWDGRGSRAASGLEYLLADDPSRPPGARACIGVGDDLAELGQTASSYRRALTALRVARSRVLGDGVLWDDLGPFRLLARLDPSVIDDLPTGLTRLLEADPGPLTRTLELYLDLGGDARAAAAALRVARGTLYYRLRRIDEITGYRLDDGLDRLALHAGLKLLRLARPAGGG
jgi:hypothetical protein